VQFAGEPHDDAADPRGHGFGASAQDRHARMVGAIADCQVLLARGMGAFVRSSPTLPGSMKRCRPTSKAAW
jgi:hypothetical protein